MSTFSTTRPYSRACLFAFISKSFFPANSFASSAHLYSFFPLLQLIARLFQAVKMSDEMLDKAMNKVRSKNDDDFVDRLNHLFTPILFFLFAISVYVKTVLTKPIECFEPPEFTVSFSLDFSDLPKLFKLIITYCFSRVGEPTQLATVLRRIPTL